MMSPLLIFGTSLSSMLSTAAAGTMSQTARGVFNFLMKSSRLSEPVAPSPTSPNTLLGFVSQTTHSCPPFSSRRTMFPPIRPNPIMPSCIRSPVPFLNMGRHTGLPGCINLR